MNILSIELVKGTKKQMEININFLLSDDHDLIDYSASQNELGDNAGKITWNNSLESGIEFVKDPDDIERIKKWFSEFGAWSKEEIQAWDNKEVNALLLQFISGDLREYLKAKERSTEEFEEWYERQGGSIFESDEGDLYYSIDC